MAEDSAGTTGTTGTTGTAGGSPTSALAPWAFVQYLDRSGRQRVGVHAGDSILALPDGVEAASALALLSDWPTLAGRLRDWVPDRAEVVARAEAVTLLAPVTYPAKVVCCGANYYDHVLEMGIEAPSGPVNPFFFLKPPTTTVVASGSPIRLPAGVRLDWEAELGVVIADRCRDLAIAEALDHVAGYVVANDISARNRLMQRDAIAPPFAFDWVAAKTLDGSCPVGPDFVPSWLVLDPQDLAIRLWVNGELKQDASTAGMITPVAAVVAAARRRFTLEPGDLFLTGTPAGVGHPRQTYLAAGDEMRLEIAGIGRLVNPVVASEGESA
jgi:2-keto-4-pentenoate hydratase/2-oxohepta-3-ene-1,7-dioic acid hydratase in catechol pathway